MDGLFSGAIPELYDGHLVPLLFTPYALDLAERAAELRPTRIFETAAGTGIVALEVAKLVPNAQIAATDLSQAMLDIALGKSPPSNVEFQQADAQTLPYPNSSFDLGLCQFGVAFFANRVAAFQEAARVLRPGGSFIFSVWDRTGENAITRAFADALAKLLPSVPATLNKSPSDPEGVASIEDDLRSAGFQIVARESLAKRSRIGTAEEAAIGLCHGTPLSADINHYGPEFLDRATEAVTAALMPLSSVDGIDAPMTAHIFSAKLAM